MIDAAMVRREVAQRLDVMADTIGDHDNLIGLGLDSITIMALAGGWRRRGIPVNFAELAASPTITAWVSQLSAASQPGSETHTGASGSVATTAESAVGSEVRGPVSADLDQPFALAPMQHAYWIGRGDEQHWGGVAAHLYVEFDGAEVDPQRLQVAVGQLVAAHPMLRTAVLPDGTQRTLHAPGRPVFTVVDHRAAAHVAAELTALRENKTHQRLAIEDGQVLDVTLSLLSGGRTRLHLDVDMIAGDAVSYRLLLADLAQLYHGDPVPAANYSYQRYRTEHVPDSGAVQRDREWWQRRLPDLPGAPELPRRAHGAQGDRNHTVRHHLWLGPAERQRLFAAAHAHAVTPAMALAAVFAETLGGWATDPRFLLNVPLFHREAGHPDVDRLVGDFTTSVMLVADVSESATVADRARALQREMHSAAAHANYTGLGVLRDLSRYRGEPTLAPVVYTSALNIGELFAPAATETFGAPVWIISQGPQVLLDAQVTELAGGVLINWDVRASAFPPGVVEAMFAHFTDSVMRLAADEGAWSHDFAPQLPASQVAVRAAVNATDGPVSGRALHEGFFDWAAVHPDDSAVVGTEIQWSYAELATRALAVAGALQEAGVTGGAAVAVQLPKGPDQIAAVLGVLAAGAAYVPIAASEPSARRAEILSNSDAVAILTAGPTDVTGIAVVDMATAARHPRPLLAPVFADTNTVAYLIFTSGSTGVPKGVEVSHQAAMNTLDAVNDWFTVGRADRVLALAALEFDASVYDIFGLLSVGGSIMALTAQQRGEPTTWVDLIRAHRVTILNCVPSVLDMILELGGDTLGNSLRFVTLGGDWVPADLARRLARQVPECRFAGLGGATETAIHHSICEIAEAAAEWTTVPFGKPLRNVRCRVVGPTGRDCPDWVTGELWVGGANVADGYRNDPNRTADRFVVHEGLRWYRTGDLARYWPDGTIEFLGRRDHQVQIRGYRIELGEVESALRAAPGVRHAVAVVLDEGAPRLAAAVTGTATVEQLQHAAAARLPAHMIPTRIHLLDTMPVTGNGKLDRRAVAQLLAATDRAPLPQPSEPTPLETAFAHIAADVLGTKTVVPHDDFFRLGGDSVQATTLIAHIRDWLTIDHATVADLFATRTLSGLAARLTSRDDRARLTEVSRLFLAIATATDEELDAATSQ